GRHVVTVAHAEQQRALGAIDVFVQLAARVHHERAGYDVDGPLGRAHLAAAANAIINLRRMGVAMIRADLARLPARDRDVALGDLAEDFLDMPLWIPLLFLVQIEHVHREAPTMAAGAMPANWRRRC